MKASNLFSLIVVLTLGNQNSAMGYAPLEAWRGSALEEAMGYALEEAMDYAPLEAIAQIDPIPLNSQLNKTQKQIKTPIQPTNPVNFTPELTIKPFSVLLDWLNNKVKTTSASRKQLRLPVVIRFKDSYRLAIGDAFVGTSDTDLDKDAIFLSLDDTSMGISLLSRLRHICPKTSNSCAVWLEGYWGSLLELDLPDLSLPGENKAKVSKWPLTVLKVHELIKQPEPGEEIRVFIESPSL